MKAPQALIRSSVIAFLLIGASALPMRAAVNRWTNLGPRSEAVVNALARDPSFPDTIYAATVGGGVFKTGDGGETWGPINNGLDDGYVTALAVDPAATGTVYAATTYAGVFKTTDGGKTWRPAVLRDSFLTALAIDPGQPSRLYAGTESGLIYRTTDGAATWTLAFPSTAAVSSIVVSPDSTAYTTTRFGVVYRSSDGGDHWNQLNTGFQRQFPYVINASLANDPSNPQTVYVVLDTTMFKTTDGGNTWSPLDGPGGHVSTIAVSPTDPKKIVAGADGKVYLSRDAAATWTRLTGLESEGHNDIRVLLVGGQPSAAVLAARGATLLEGSTEGEGQPWRAVTAGLDAATVPTVAVSPSDPSKLLATDGFHPIHSGDAGENWSVADSAGASGFYNFTYSPADSSEALAGTSNGVLRTEDGGASWQTTVLGTRYYTSASGFAFSSTSPETVYAATSEGVQRSTDGGRHWAQTGQRDSAYAVLADRLNPSVVYAVYLPGYLYYGPFTPTIAKSADAGDTWSAAEAGLPGTGISTVVMDSADTQTLYAGTFDQGVYKTTNGATSWKRANAGIEQVRVSSIAVDPADSLPLYASADRGIFRSGDAAASWLPFNDGLANLQVTALSIDSSGRHLYASTAGSGIFGMEIQPVGSPCEEAEGRACYFGRFLVSASARPPSGNLPPLPVPIRQGDRFGSFRLGPASVAAPDIFVKIVDGRSLPGSAFWVFHAGLTRDDYTLTVTDTATGWVRVYQNGANRPGCGGIDTLAFQDAGPLGSRATPASTLEPGDGRTLSLYGGRYNVILSATDPRSGQMASGFAMPQADRDGYFSLPDFTGDPAFPEVFVRVSEQPDGSLAFSHTGLTDLAYTLTVTNTDTAAVQTYGNNLADPSHPCGGAAAAP